MHTRRPWPAAALALVGVGVLCVLAGRSRRPTDARKGRFPRSGPGATVRRALADGPSAEHPDGTPRGSREAAEALRRAEIPAAGFPSDRNADAHPIHPGLADFARGA